MVASNKDVRGLGILYTSFGLPTIESLHKDESLGAVLDPDWQHLRVSMRHLSTFSKLCILQTYWNRVRKAPEATDRDRHLAKVRISLYLNELKHHGQISKTGRIQR